MHSFNILTATPSKLKKLQLSLEKDSKFINYFELCGEDLFSALHDFFEMGEHDLGLQGEEDCNEAVEMMIEQWDRVLPKKAATPKKAMTKKAAKAIVDAEVKEWSVEQILNSSLTDYYSERMQSLLNGNG